MGWSSIYNQVLSAFFFLLAFHFLLRHIETGRRVHEIAHWTAFVLGLGALEINVVYPALAALHVAFHKPPYLKRILPMFALSLAAVLMHFYFAPPPHSGVYAPRVDAAIVATLWTYWRWVLGPMPAIGAAIVAVSPFMAKLPSVGYQHLGDEFRFAHGLAGERRPLLEP